MASLLETLWAMGQDIVLQEYIRESKGRDIRAIVVGGRVVAAMRRTAKAGEFRSNLHRGGLGIKVKLDRRYTQRRGRRDPGHGARGRRRRHARRDQRAQDPRNQQLAGARRDRASERHRRRDRHRACMPSDSARGTRGCANATSTTVSPKRSTRSVWFDPCERAGKRIGNRPRRTRAAFAARGGFASVGARRPWREIRDKWLPLGFRHRDSPATMRTRSP